MYKLISKKELVSNTPVGATKNMPWEIGLREKSSFFFIDYDSSWKGGRRNLDAVQTRSF